MKCPKCGAPIKMEEKFCTYCGEPNTLAMKHAADMERYEQEFSETQETVLTKSRRAGSLVGFLIALIVLIVLNIVAGFVNANAWSFKYDRQKQNAAKQAAKHKEAIEKMIEEQDYISLGEYYYTNRLSGSDAFQEYEAVTRYARCLDNVYSYLLNFDSYRYQFSEDRMASSVSMMADELIRLYENPRSSYYPDEAVTDEKIAVIEDIRTQAEAILVGYAGFAPEEVGELASMSKSRIEAALTEHLTAVMNDKEAQEKADDMKTESVSLADLTDSMSMEEIQEFFANLNGGDGV